MAPAAQRKEETNTRLSTDPTKAEQINKDILSKGPGSTETASRDYEAALIGLGELYRDTKRPKELADLIKASRDSFSSFAKAKTAKLGMSLYLNLLVYLSSSAANVRSWLKFANFWIC
jgi:hypothetical protein